MNDPTLGKSKGQRDCGLSKGPFVPIEELILGSGLDQNDHYHFEELGVRT